MNLIERCETRLNNDETLWCDWKDDILALIAIAKKQEVTEAQLEEVTFDYIQSVNVIGHLTK